MAENSVAEKDPKAYKFNCCQRGEFIAFACPSLPMANIWRCL
jgi:hypothetical protein